MAGYETSKEDPEANRTLTEATAAVERLVKS